NDTHVGIEAIQAHFQNAGIVPSLLRQFTPTALLSLSYDGVSVVQPGQNLTTDAVKPVPQLQITPLNSSVSVAGRFTVAMVDAGIVGADESKGQTRHWLSNGATISGNKIVFTNATNITDYTSPLPAKGSGAHRYVVLVYAQPPSFAPPVDLAVALPVGTYDLNQYANSSGLGGIIAGTYYDVQQGPSTVSVSATSPVLTSTLPGAILSASSTASPSA
ncbi:phosphatidylethanolamine-binding protein, partial [Hysterangium stoloniferum]